MPAHTGADEGTIQESSSLIPGMFRRPGGEFLFHVEKEPKDARGQAQMSAPRSYSPVPWTPIYGGRQLGKLICLRKGADSSADWFSFYNRCR